MSVVLPAANSAAGWTELMYFWGHAERGTQVGCEHAAQHPAQQLQASWHPLPEPRKPVTTDTGTLSAGAILQRAEGCTQSLAAAARRRQAAAAVGGGPTPARTAALGSAAGVALN